MIRAIEFEIESKESLRLFAEIIEQSINSRCVPRGLSSGLRMRTMRFQPVLRDKKQQRHQLGSQQFSRRRRCPRID